QGDAVPGSPRGGRGARARSARIGSQALGAEPRGGGGRVAVARRRLLRRPRLARVQGFRRRHGARPRGRAARAGEVGARPASPRRPVSRLDASFFARSVHEVAPDLIGCGLRFEGVGGIIVEVEAYEGTDPASHSYRGLTRRTAPMFGPPAHAYVYLSYGIHTCLNL